MRSRSRDNSKRNDNNKAPATETDPLIATENRNTIEGHFSDGSIRSRRGSSRSPSALQQLHFQSTPRTSSTISDPDYQVMDTGIVGESSSHHQGDSRPGLPQSEPTYASTQTPYQVFSERLTQPQHQEVSTSKARPRRLAHAVEPTLDHVYGDFNRPPQAREIQPQNAAENAGDQPLFEMPEEIYAVRKNALQVMKPLISTWLVFSIGFSMTALLGAVSWTRLINNIPYWFVLLPSWLSHFALLYCHISSAKALSVFIAEANENRQRPDSTDHLDRTEYLPLLQRSLKFGLKTGLLSFFMFVFEVLVYLRLARGNIPVAITLIPIWILVCGGILDGIICKTQHWLKLICWILVFAAMLLIVLRVDYGLTVIKWRVVISPLVAVLCVSSGLLIYIIYGHQVGYYRLTEAQLTAGILYSMASMIFIILLIVVSEVIPLERPVELETRFFVIVMAPLVVCLVGMGAWAVSRDEFARLLLYGGQAAVHPMKLRLESNGWTTCETKGVAIIPMFGEVSCKPLEKSTVNAIELCSCCACYPYEVDDEGTIQYPDQMRWENPYLAPSSTQPSGDYSLPQPDVETQRMAV